MVVPSVNASSTIFEKAMSYLSEGQSMVGEEGGGGGEERKSEGEEESVWRGNILKRF